MTGDPLDSLAQRFHEAYERLAPEYSYETRRESAVPWGQVPASNRALMEAVVAEVCGPLVEVARAARDLTDDPFGQLDARRFYRLREALARLDGPE